ncbi:MAG: NfeD family protein [Fulvivirga sp.]|uniref:NfeD family protein n=1 Tax=Fulvivirga sp. TaxID=1931237 RepID=UPI0032EE4A58
MGDWVTVIALVVAGILLLIAEVLFVPGTTVVGILGVACAIFGIYLSFEYFGTTTATWFTVGSTIGFAIALYYSFKSRTWERFSLKDTNSGKVNENLTSLLEVGLEGMAISSLKPVGKAEINDVVYEVKTLGEYVDSGQRLKIIKIDKNNITVEPIN